MTYKSFGVNEINIVGSSAGVGTPTMESPNNLNLNANRVAISTDIHIGRNVNVVGIITTTGDLNVGVNTSKGLILSSPNGTKYRLIVDNSGILSTVTI